MIIMIINAVQPQMKWTTGCLYLRATVLDSKDLNHSDETASYLGMRQLSDAANYGQIDHFQIWICDQSI